MAENIDVPLKAYAEAALISTDDIRGKSVHGRDGDKIGTIDKIIIDERTGHVAYFVVSTGGFLGLGQSYHPIPWAAFRYDEKRSGYAVAIDRRLLEGAPSFRPDSAPVFDEAYGRRVTDYFRIPPA